MFVTPVVNICLTDQLTLASTHHSQKSQSLHSQEICQCASAVLLQIVLLSVLAHMIREDSVESVHQGFEVSSER